MRLGRLKPHFIRYHDGGWAIPVHDDRTHFEMRLFEGARADLTGKRFCCAVKDIAKLFSRWKTVGQVPVITAEGDALSIDLKQRGFRLVGEIVCAYMQTVWLVNDPEVIVFFSTKSII